MTMHEEAMEFEETINVEEEAAPEPGNTWTEEVVVAGEDLLGFVKNLVKETAVRRLVIKNEKRHIHLEIPLALGVVGIAWLPVFSAVALIAALVTDCTILVERAVDEPVEKEPETAVE
ncbi:MAG: DUF4342 domain-containing protein [Ardenticatenaceae bacterium]|nr:DUF4342 domain-containing protein [Ardenticatenaceae bacterium]MCB8990773.1 DUF4342 domain-containing protein [Ardenticatenaceae bacterium]MCB9003260.1 DUF4342 domain-containing protein [Ardenticatenaceae bacterium]